MNNIIKSSTNINNYDIILIKLIINIITIIILILKIILQ